VSESEVKKCPKCGKEMEIGYLPGAFSWSAGRRLWSIKMHACSSWNPSGGAFDSIKTNKGLVS